MVAYVISVLPLIQCLKAAYLDVTQTWYADNTGSASKFDNLELYFNSLQHNDPTWGH